jgi:hypothetical protein
MCRRRHLGTASHALKLAIRRAGTFPLSRPSQWPRPEAPKAGATLDLMGGLHHVAREASFEAKESDESRNSIGCHRGSVAGGRRVRDSRWSVGRYTDGQDWQSLSMRKKYRTLAYRLSMSSTTKAPEHVVLAYSLPRGRAVDRGKVAEAVEVAAEAPQPAQPAQAAAGGRMVCRGASRYRLNRLDSFRCRS